MATDSELAFLIFHLIRFLLNLVIFISALIFLLIGCLHDQLRTSKRQWLMFNLCIGIIIFAIINSIFTMLPFAPTYLTIIAGQVCTIQHFLEDIAQGQVAYSLIAMGIHQIGPEEWKNRSYIWFGSCIIIQWLCSYLFPLPQILNSNLYICFAFFPDKFFVIYSIIFLLALPVLFHLLIYIIGNIWRKTNTNTTQVYPVEHVDQIEIEIDHSSLMMYIFIMGLLFNIIGYGPKGLLAAIDYQLKESFVLYAGLDILPSLCLLFNIGLLYKMNKEIRKKILSLCKC